jgi:hypothetical protein
MPAATKTRKAKGGAFEAALAEYQRASKKRKRHTPTRMASRKLWKWLRKDPLWALGTLAVVLAVGAGTVWHFYGVRAVAAGAAVLTFLVVCEAWPELLKWAHLNRRHFVPFAALALMAAPAVLAWRSPYWAALTGLFGLLFVFYSHANLRARAREHSHAAGYIPRAWLPMAYLAAGWTGLAARLGVTRQTVAVLLAGWVVWAVRFWFVNRSRGASTDLPLAKKWAETIANPDYPHIDSGKKLVGSKLVNVRSVPGGMAATVVLPPGQEGSQVDSRGEVIASVYGTLVTDVTIDESKAANMREMFVLPRSPLRKPHHWKGSDLNLNTWISTVGSYIDGERVQYVWCIPESGPWHDLIAGTTRAGKSRLLDQLLTTSRQAKGYMVDWVIDPQNGQSLPDWVDEVDWFAAGVDEGMKVLRGARALMYARNLVFAGREHTDRKGRTKKGMKGFTPTLEYPQINLTIDEAHAILQIPEAVTILAEMGKMGSKCGIKVRLVVHLPLLSELGGSSVLRDMVASGNVFVLRTASRITGQVAFQGALPVDPVTIPRRMPDGSSSGGLGFALGADSRRAPMRLDWVEDPLDLIEGIPITHLSDDEARAAGADYAQYRGLRFDEDIIDVEVIEDAPATGAEPQETPGNVLRGPGAPGCEGAFIAMIKAYADQAQYPGARVSRDEIVPKLLRTWKNRQITNTLKEVCDHPDKPVWSDDDRSTFYYKEAS